MRIESLYRYPVKGLTPEALDEVRLEPGRCLPWDRAFALAQGDGTFDPAAPGWVPKTNFMCLLRNARIALLRTRFDEAAGMLRLTSPAGETFAADPMTAAGQAALTAYLIDFLGQEARFGVGGAAPDFQFVEGHSFCDHRTQVVSLIGLGSLRALEEAAGAVRDKRRFRANIYVDDIPAWAEFDWIGRTLRVGETTMVVQERIDRCGATTVNPDTAVRDANPVRELQRGFGHVDLGVFAKVMKGGMVRPGDEISL